MSWAYLALYTGDYIRDTRTLSCTGHGIYLLFLMHYWDSRSPLPLDEQDCAAICNARSATEIETMRQVLCKFFVRMDDGWYNRRMQKEIERASAISKSRGESGRLGGMAKAKQLPSKRQAIASNTTITTIPALTQTSEKQKRGATAPFVLPDWVPEQQWHAWVEARTKARKPPTDWAKRLAVRRLEDFRDQGHSPALVLAESAFNGWAGLFPPKGQK